MSGSSSNSIGGRNTTPEAFVKPKRSGFDDEESYDLFTFIQELVVPQNTTTSTDEETTTQLRDFEKVTDCSICMEPFTSRCRAQPCGHLFDLECIKLWFEQQCTTAYVYDIRAEDDSAGCCPLCRQKMQRVECGYRPKDGKYQYYLTVKVRLEYLAVPPRI